jgi:hypothetical protein
VLKELTAALDAKPQAADGEKPVLVGAERLREKQIPPGHLFHMYSTSSREDKRAFS